MQRLKQCDIRILDFIKVYNIVSTSSPEPVTQLDLGELEPVTQLDLGELDWTLTSSSGTTNISVKVRFLIIFTLQVEF